jgi:hypothetical protein
MPSKTKKTTHQASTETNHEEKTAMPTTSQSHHARKTTHATETPVVSSTLEEAPVQQGTHPSVAATPAPAPAPASAPVAAVAPPPASANIPAPPPGFTPATPGEFRSVVPRKAELAALPQALTDLSKFTDFDTLFSGIGLTLAQTTQCLLMGSLWSTMRVATLQWDKCCVLQEGYAWQAIRAALLRLEQAFLLAAQANPKLVTMYPGLSSLLGAKKSIAQKGASTRRLNKAAVANGEPANHGVVGKKRQRKAEKAALANAPPAPAAPAPAAGPVAQPTPAVPAPVNGVANGVTNGAAR